VSPADSTRDVSQEDFLYHLYRGSELLQDNRILEAKEELEQALTMQPLDAKGQDLLGAVYFRLGLYPRAIQIYEGLEGQFPGDVSIKMNLGLCYLKTGQPEPARRVLREVVEINPDHKRAWGYLGLALQKLGELEQAQIAFEKGDRPAMARRVTEFRRSLFPPAEHPPSDLRLRADEDRPSSPSSAPPGAAQEVRDMADTAFSELDAGGLHFALAEAAPQPPGDGAWHTLELGASGKRKSKAPKSPFTKTLPPPWMAGLDADQDATRALLPSIPLSAPPVPRVVPILEVPASPPATPQPPRFEPPAQASEPVDAPILFAAQGDAPVVRLPSGVVLVRTGGAAAQDATFATRLDAIRVVSGAVTTRILNRRSKDGDTGEVLGGVGRPVVRVAGDARLVLGAQAQQVLALFPVDDDIAFVREDVLVGFELGLQYENGRVALEAGSAEKAAIVQLRGSGTFVVETAGELARLPSRSGEPLLVRREWVVGWFGRLVARPPTSREAIGGHRGLVAFWGEGSVLVGVA
jgi:hypothetical protein